MTSLTVTPRNVSADPTQGAVIRQYQVALQITNAPGKGVALDSNGKLTLAQSDGTAAEAKGIGVIVNLANLYGELTANADSWVSVCELGPVYGFSGMTPGTFGYVSATAGDIDDTKPTASGRYPHVLGQAQAANVFFVNPGITRPESI